MNKKNLENPANMIGIMVLMGVGLFTAIGFIGQNYSNNGAIGEWITGTLGISISFCTLFLLYYTYMAQKQELATTKEQIKAQNNMAAQQKFETTFLNLLSLFRESAKEFNKDVSAIELNIKATLTHTSVGTNNPNALLDIIRKYEELKSKYTTFENYFKMLAYILEFIENSNFEDDYKKNFYKLVEKTMPDGALYTTFFECQSVGNNSLQVVKRVGFLDDYLRYGGYSKHNLSPILYEGFISNK